MLMERYFIVIHHLPDRTLVDSFLQTLVKFFCIEIFSQQEKNGYICI